MIQILGLLGMYFDAVVVEVKTFLLLFRLALDILWEEGKGQIGMRLWYSSTCQSEGSIKLLIYLLTIYIGSN